MLSHSPSELGTSEIAGEVVAATQRVPHDAGDGMRLRATLSPIWAIHILAGCRAEIRHSKSGYSGGKGSLLNLAANRLGASPFSCVASAYQWFAETCKHRRYTKPMLKRPRGWLSWAIGDTVADCARSLLSRLSVGQYLRRFVAERATPLNGKVFTPPTSHVRLRKRQCKASTIRKEA